MASTLSDNLLSASDKDAEVPSIAEAEASVVTVTTEKPKVTTMPSAQHANPTPPRKLSTQHGGQPSNDEIQSMMVGAMGMIVLSLTVLGAVMWGFFGFVASWSSHTVATLLTLLVAGALTYLYSSVDLPLTSITGPAANSKPFRTFKAPHDTNTLPNRSSSLLTPPFLLHRSSGPFTAHSTGNPNADGPTSSEAACSFWPWASHHCCVSLPSLLSSSLAMWGVSSPNSFQASGTVMWSFSARC